MFRKTINIKSGGCRKKFLRKAYKSLVEKTHRKGPLS
jgi:hypothetical protein